MWKGKGLVDRLESGAGKGGDQYTFTHAVQKPFNSLSSDVEPTLV